MAASTYMASSLPIAATLALYSIRRCSSKLKSNTSGIAVGERNQDILVATHRDGMIYNGCRSHYIRRLKADNLLSTTAFEPPHFDYVTGLCWLDNHLVSAGKDNVLKVWDVSKKDSKPLPVYQEVNATKKSPKVMRENAAESMAFTADEAGEIKFWQLNGPALKCLGGFTPSTVSGNLTQFPVMAAEWIRGMDNTLLCSSGDRNLMLYRITNSGSEF